MQLISEKHFQTLHFFKKVIILLFVFIAFSACKNDITVVNSITSALEQKLPIESGINVEIIYSDSAIVRAKLNAPKLDRYLGKKPYMEMTKGMQVIFYDENRKEQSKLTANYVIACFHPFHPITCIIANTVICSKL